MHMSKPTSLVERVYRQTFHLAKHHIIQDHLLQHLAVEALDLFSALS